MGKKISDAERRGIEVAHGIAEAYKGGMAALATLMSLATNTDRPTEPQHHQDAAPAVAQSKGTQPSLSDAQKAEVVRLFDGGRGTSVRRLAEKFGVSRNVINRALQAAGIKKKPV